MKYVVALEVFASCRRVRLFPLLEPVFGSVDVIMLPSHVSKGEDVTLSGL